MSRSIRLLIVSSCVGLGNLAAQAPSEPRPAPQTAEAPAPVLGGDRMRGPGPGGPPMTERKIVKQFDKDGDKRLNPEERAAAREFIKKENANRPRGRFFGGPPGAGRGGPPLQPSNANPPGDAAPLPAGNPGAPVPPNGPGNGAPSGRLFGPGFGRGMNQEPAKPGVRISPDEVPKQEVSSLYAPNVLRTLFLDFESQDWEQEMADFNDTDVDLPATLTVDGEKYPGVGVHFRGMSSFMMVREGRKRSLNVSLDFTDKKQRLDGYKTLNLLNGNGDASMMSTVLYSEIARHYLSAPKANLVRVVINGENWGVYTNVQQFNKDFLQENYRTEKGARWKVKGSPGGGGGLEYLGEDLAEYRRRYDLKTDENEEDWKALVNLCKVLKETPPEKLEEALKPIANVENLLWFLALDCALINSDGYWVRASDYSIYRDKNGKFQFIPHDMNEAFRAPEGPGMGARMGGLNGQNGGGRREPRRERDGDSAAAGNPPTISQAPVSGPKDLPAPSAQTERPAGAAPEGAGAAPLPPAERPQLAEPRPPGNGDSRQPDFRGPAFAFGPGGFGGGPAVKGVELDPLVGLDDERKPLRSKVLAVPALRERYLAKVRLIAEEWLDWNKLGPLVAQYRGLIEKEIAAETRGLSSFAAFQEATVDEAKPAEGNAGGGRHEMSIRAFADQRREYLLNHPEIKKLAAKE